MSGVVDYACMDLDERAFSGICWLEEVGSSNTGVLMHWFLGERGVGVNEGVK